MKNIKVCFSHNSDNWRTPSYIYNFFVEQHGFIDLFPYCSDLDQYEINYKKKKLFCNPPFSQMNKVSDYLIRQYDYGNDIVLLCPARTDTQWFHKLLDLCPLIMFFKGRLHFNDSKNVAPFPTILMIFNHKKEMCMWTLDLFKVSEELLHKCV